MPYSALWACFLVLVLGIDRGAVRVGKKSKRENILHGKR